MRSGRRLTAYPGLSICGTHDGYFQEDGPVVEEASRRALSDGVNLRDLLKEMARRKGLIKAGVVLMGYLNPFLQYGLEELGRDAEKAGVHGLIVPDLPHEESAPMRAALGKYGIALIPLVGPNTSEERMALYAAEGQGYVYVVSVMGITGERGGLAPQVADHETGAQGFFPAAGLGLRPARALAAFGTAHRGLARRRGLRQRFAETRGCR